MAARCFRVSRCGWRTSSGNWIAGRPPDGARLLPYRFGDHHDALRVGRAVVLADAAAGAAAGVDFDVPVLQFDGFGADGAEVDAARAFLAGRADADVEIPVGRAQVDLGP